MPEFVYSARDGMGKRFTGRIEAETREAALKNLSGKFEVVTQLDPVSSGGLAAVGIGGVKTEDLLAFTMQMAAMLRSGINLKRALELTVEESPSAALRSAVVDVAATISSGGSLSGALGQHPRIFDTFYLSLIKAGEASGDLSGSMDRLARHIESGETLRKKVQASLYYPLLVAIFAVIVVGFIIVMGVPRIQTVYADMGTALPVPTQMLVGVSTFLASNWMIWVPLVIVLAIVAGMMARTEQVGTVIDRIKITAPVLAPLFRTLSAARFARTLASLSRSGVPILEAMDLTAGSVGNRVVAEGLRSAIPPVREGQDLPTALKATGMLPPMALGMTAAGAEAGRLDEMLETLADFYDAQTEIRLQALASLIEPTVMIFVGISIGVVVVTLALPFMNLAQAIQ